MTKILGLVGSARRGGNCESLVKAAMRGAKDAGAAVELVRLGELKVLPCRGCMACVFKDVPCKLDDDVEWLFEKISSADGFILAAPTYFLGAAGILKMVIDRYLMLIKQVPQFSGKRAGLISVSGLSRWDQLAMLSLRTFALGLNHTVVGEVKAYAPGPSQTLLDRDIVTRVTGLGYSVASGTFQPLRHDRRSCPTCGNDLLKVHENGVVECPLCLGRGVVTTELGCTVVDFNPNPHPRFSPESMYEHLTGWILKTQEPYVKNREMIVQLRDSLAEFDKCFAMPPVRKGRAVRA